MKQYIVLAISFLAYAISIPATAQVRYSVTEIEPPSGVESVTASGLNDLGQVVGSVGGRSFLWDESSGSRYLDLLPEDLFNSATDINSAGQIVGTIRNSANSRAFIWDGASGLVHIGDLPGGRNSSSAIAINDAGQVVGTSVAAAGSRAYIWDPVLGMVDLGTLGGGSSSASDINNAGQVVGKSDGRVFLWESSLGMTSIAELSTFGSSQSGLNNAGQVVGRTNGRAFQLDSGSNIQDLGALPGHPESAALDINNAGQVVGWSGFTGSPEAPIEGVIWDPEFGVLNLRELIAPTDPLFGEVFFDLATAINERGQIIAIGDPYFFGFDSNPSFLLTPVPIPATAWLLSSAVVLLGGVRIRCLARANTKL